MMNLCDQILSYLCLSFLGLCIVIVFPNLSTVLLRIICIFVLKNLDEMI
jgi:hypothetical protein